MDYGRKIERVFARENETFENVQFHSRLRKAIRHRTLAD